MNIRLLLLFREMAQHLVLANVNVKKVTPEFVVVIVPHITIQLLRMTLQLIVEVSEKNLC